MDLWISVAIIFVLVSLSAFFSGSETALTAASKARLTGLEKEGNARAGLVNQIRERKERLIGSLLLGNNLVNILASSIATSVLIKLVGEAGVVYATLVMTLLILIFAEVLPKTYALHHADKMSMAIAPIIRVIVWVFFPVAEAINRIVRFTLKLFGSDLSKVSAGSHMDVLRGVIEMHQGPDQETLDQRAMLRSILDLKDVWVEEIMTHRKNVQMVNSEDDVQVIVEAVMASPYTRLPVYAGDPDNIIGVMHAKALLRALQAHHGRVEEINVQTLIAEPWFIPETTDLWDQLQAFRSRREHFAIVIDEYGDVQGIVTLEDILEEIVGEIDDEHDIAVSGVRKQSGGAYLIDGTVTIRDLNREFHWDLPDEDYSTIAGLLIHEAKIIPNAGQSFSFYGFQFDVVKRHRNQITLVRVMPDTGVDQATAP